MILALNVMVLWAESMIKHVINYLVVLHFFYCATVLIIDWVCIGDYWAVLNSLNLIENKKKYKKKIINYFSYLNEYNTGEFYYQ